MIDQWWGYVKKLIHVSDIILEVVDARCIGETRNKNVEELVKKENKKLIIVVNKADLVPEDFIKSKIKDIEFPVVYLSSKTRKGLRKLREKLSFLAKKYKKERVLVSIVGYANTGKSSLINALVGRKVAPTAPVPGFTRGKQWIRLSRKIRLMDTPGIIPSDKNIFRGAIKAEKIKEPVNPALELISKILEFDPKILEEKYKIKINGDKPYQILEKIAKRLNKVRKGGELDIETVARILIKDWYQGELVIWF